MAIPKRIRIYSNGNPVDGTKIVDADTGEETDYIKEIKIHMLPHEIKAEVWYDGDATRRIYLNGDVELGDWDEYQQKQKAPTGRKADIKIILNPDELKAPTGKIIDDPPCSECDGKGYVDLATSRQSCQKCNTKPTSGGVVQGTMPPIVSEIILNPDWKPRCVDPESRVGVLGPRSGIEIPVEMTIHSDKLYNYYHRTLHSLKDRPNDPFFATEAEARLAAMQNLRQLGELQGIDREWITSVVESWLLDLVECEDQKEFEAMCCDMAGEILENVEEDSSGIVTENINCRCISTSDSQKTGVALEGAAASELTKVSLDFLKKVRGRQSEAVVNRWDDSDGDPVADLESAKRMIAGGVNPEKRVGVALESASAGEPYKVSLDSLKMGEGRQSEAVVNPWNDSGRDVVADMEAGKKIIEESCGYTAERDAQEHHFIAEAMRKMIEDKIRAAAITPQNIGGVCKVCQRPTPMGVQCCDVCKCERQRQVRELARDQIKKKLVKAGDTVGITFDPDGEVVICDIKTHTNRVTLYGELRREKKGYIYKELVEIVEDANTKEECSECYGTGFQSGFGAPCSKGCKP